MVEKDFDDEIVQEYKRECLRFQRKEARNFWIWGDLSNGQNSHNDAQLYVSQ